MSSISNPTSVFFLLVLFVIVIQMVDCEIEHDDPCAEMPNITFDRGDIVKYALQYRSRHPSSSAMFNFIVSPLAVYNSLYLLYRGSAGKSARDFMYGMEEGFAATAHDWPSDVEKLQACLFSQTSNATLTNVNTFILNCSLQLYNNHHLDGFNNMFNAVVKNQPMREWFPLMCLAGIRDFTSTQLLVASDVQFAAQLALPFRREEQTQDFHTPGEIFKPVDMMTVTARVMYLDTKMFGKYIEIPYEGNNGSFALYLHMPRYKNYKLITVSSRMKEVYEVISSQMHDFKSMNVELHVPRFELQALPSDPRNTIRALGLGFLYENPDLTGIVSDGTLKMIKMIHRTSFTVAENPKQASANTPAHDTTSAPETVLSFNRPFYAIVLHRPSNTPVLTAYIQDPTLDPVSSIAPSINSPPIADSSDNTAQHITFALGEIIRAGVDSQLQPTASRSLHNIVISPFTIYNSLYLLYNGSACQTAADLISALRLPPFYDDQLAFKQWQTSLFGKGLLTIFIVDDSLQLDREYALYVNDNVLFSNVRSVSIRRASCNSVNASSSLLKLVCMSPIRNDFNSAHLLAFTAMGLNATMLTLPFHRLEQTEDFYLSNEVKRVEMISLTARLRYYRSQGSQRFGEIVEIPYGGSNGDFALYLHLERDLVESHMRFFYRVICTQMGLFKPTYLELHVPSFEMIPDPIDLEDTIRALGLGILYDNPDLTGIVSDGTLKNIRMIHKPSFTVAENRNQSTTKTPPQDTAATVLRFNRPFYAIVLHRPSNTPVLAAYIQDPTLDPPVISQPRHEDSTLPTSDIEPSPTQPLPSPQPSPQPPQQPTATTQSCPSCCHPPTPSLTCWSIANRLLESFPRQPYTAESLKYFEYEMLCHRPGVCPK